MKKILQYDTHEGESLYVEISDADSGEVSRGERDVIQNVNERFDKALKPLKDISNTIIKCVKEIPNNPEEVAVELGLKFTAKAGIILTSLDSEAHLKITFKWNNSK